MLATRREDAFLGRECVFKLKAASAHEKNGVRYRVKRSGAVKPPPFIFSYFLQTQKSGWGAYYDPPIV